MASVYVVVAITLAELSAISLPELRRITLPELRPDQIARTEGDHLTRTDYDHIPCLVPMNIKRQSEFNDGFFAFKGSATATLALDW